MAANTNSTDPIPTPGGRHAYEVSRGLSSDVPFYSLIMAAMRRADSMNAIALRTAFPEVWDELQARYNAPGGILPQEERA